MELFFDAVQKQTEDRDAGIIPDLESYIDVSPREMVHRRRFFDSHNSHKMRRDTSGCKPSFDLIEYAMGIDLPDFVMDHPVIRALNQFANDLVTFVQLTSFSKAGLTRFLSVRWSNVRYNVSHLSFALR